MIASLLSQISTLTFMQPLLLSGLLTLPLLWWVLRITPPAPKTVFFPATRFLTGLISDQNTPSASPWWILLLRLLICALIIIALARPVTNPAKPLDVSSDVRIFIDNDWASAQVWDLQINAAKDIIAQADRSGRSVYILPSISSENKTVTQHGPMPADQALSVLSGLTPYPWSARYGKITEFLRGNVPSDDIHTIWLSHGLRNKGTSSLIDRLKQQGSLHIVRPSAENTPLLLRPYQGKPARNEKASDVRISVEGMRGARNVSATVQVRGQNGTIIDAKTQVLTPDKPVGHISFDKINADDHMITGYSIAGRKGAGAHFVLSSQKKKPSVGIVAPVTDDSAAPLTQAEYFLKRALFPYSHIETGTLSDLLGSNLSVIILPDVANMPSETLNALEKWVNDGGLLLRFAGTNMAASRQHVLTPVRLRSGERALSGSLSWEEPQTIAAFNEDSPLFGLDIPSDISINQQILAEPSIDDHAEIWAQLTDGTPFITASRKENGRIVLIHTTANADWSDFALSGLYLQTLKRIIGMAGQKHTVSSKNSYASLDPIMVMDGFGNMITPPVSVLPLPVQDIKNALPSRSHPPGIYGKGAMRYALNIGDHLPALQNAPSDINVSTDFYNRDYETDTSPFFLYCAFILFLLDWIIMMFIAGHIRSFLRRTALPLIMLFCCIFTGAAHADQQRDIQYANGLYLAYIETGDPSVDTVTQRGLEILSDVLARRTSVEPEGVVALNPETGTLSFFPLIYWSIVEGQKPYSAKAMENIQNYLSQGGTILFDTRDQNQSTNRDALNTSHAAVLRAITTNLNIPALSPIPDDHVLGRSFYLLDTYPGRYNSGTLWIEEHSAAGRDNVSSVLIGGNDWATSWADAKSASPMNRHSRSYGAKQKEMSLRFGVNLVMYVLTGNYKADQVHIPHILERLGR